MLIGFKKRQSGLTVVESVTLLAVSVLLAIVVVPVLLTKAGILTPPVPATETHKPLRPDEWSEPQIKVPSVKDLTPPEVIQRGGGSSGEGAKGAE